MTWKSQFSNQLNTLTGNGGELAVDVPAGRLLCDVISVDAIGCAFNRIALETDKFAGYSIDELKALSERLSAQINYLLEPISPIEIDAEGATVQMRSNPPQKDDDGTKYYELLAGREGLALVRYSRPQGELRSRVPANVTREVLLRLAGDFVAAVR